MPGPVYSLIFTILCLGWIMFCSLFLCQKTAAISLESCRTQTTCTPSVSFIWSKVAFRILSVVNLLIAMMLLFSGVDGLK